jgi:hypothetical protein
VSAAEIPSRDAMRAVVFNTRGMLRAIEDGEFSEQGWTDATLQEAVRNGLVEFVGPAYVLTDKGRAALNAEGE